MSTMISTAPGFQYSVNIAYDLNNKNKIKNYIPTNSGLKLLEEILITTRDSSSDRSRILIGAYGSGKSHIILIILSILMKKDLSLFEKAMPKIHENQKLYQTIKNYYESDSKLLPVIISGSNTSLSQAFLIALQKTLKENNLMDIMPETNYKAAVTVIQRWKEEFPETYEKLKSLIDIPIDDFINNLRDYNIEAYKNFENVYPLLTAGSIFNPFLGFDIVEIYEEVIKSIKKRGYSGIYVVYDEFSKYLEANITEASVSDTKMLQDFAEKCNRSGENQLHIILISHKEISNYIDKLPKHKVDGWRGISERFKHIHLNNNFTQTYEIIASVIEKDEVKWDKFSNRYKQNFTNLYKRYNNHIMFQELDNDEMLKIIYSCYPLHPVSTFVLPRLSQKIAQNERTLFTFLSANSMYTLSAFLKRYNDDRFVNITPDMIFNYFEPLLKKEVYSDEIYKNYRLTSVVLKKIEENSLESKIVKTISLIYILEQFEVLKPTIDEIVGIYSTDYTVDDIKQALSNLIEKNHVIYLKQYNNYLQLKQTSGINIKQKILDTIESYSNQVSVKAILNDLNFDNYLYPSRYNDTKEMRRYFSFEFIDEAEVDIDIDWKVKSENIYADGVIYGVILENKDSISDLKDRLIKSSCDCKRIIFILPRDYVNIGNIAKEFYAVSILRNEAIQVNDQTLFDEYDIIYEDLYETVIQFISAYTHPEEQRAIYVHNGNVIKILRKAELSNLMSDICDSVFYKTPVINNEVINRDELTTIAFNSRHKIITSLLRNKLEPDLGLTGYGQDVSIMRSTLIRTRILVEKEGFVEINLQPNDKHLKDMLNIIVKFIHDARKQEQLSFDELYKKLILPEYNIGLRKGSIPIFLAVAIHVYNDEIVILDQYNEQVPITADIIEEINDNPSDFSLTYIEWNSSKEEYIQNLEEIFIDYIMPREKSINSYEYIISAMKRWYLSLPKYSKEADKTVAGNKINVKYKNMIKLLRRNIGGHALLFEELPKIFGYKKSVDFNLSEEIKEGKLLYDNLLTELNHYLIEEVKKKFILNQNESDLENMSLTSIIKDWCETLDSKVFEQLFNDGTDRCLNLFKEITNNEEEFIIQLAKIATDLRIEDWDYKTIETFLSNLDQYKNTAENFQNIVSEETELDVNTYEVSYVDQKGETVTKRFNKIEGSKRGNLLYNSITSAIESMGNAITEQEKRQILMEILKEYC